MRITIASVLVDDQEKALQFYTDKLGFLKKTDVPTRRVPMAHGRLARAARRRRASPRAGRPSGCRPFKERSSPTAFRGPRSASPMPARSTSGSRRPASGSSRSRPRWVRS